MSSVSRDVPPQENPKGDSVKDSSDLDWDWLDTNIEDSYCYMSHVWSHTGKTVDFGKDGFTASVSDWHYLLQITAPHPSSGLVYARGDYPDRSSSILARAQDKDGRGSWSFRISNTSEVMIKDCIGQGLLNYRWPYMAYDLKLKQAPKMDGARDIGLDDSDLAAGTLHNCSFVKDGTVYQISIIRIGPKVVNQKKLVFTLGGQVRFSLCGDKEAYKATSSPVSNIIEPLDNTRISATSPVAVGAASNTDDAPSTKADGVVFNSEDILYDLRALNLSEGQVMTATCRSSRYDNVRLDMQAFMNSKRITIRKSMQEDDTNLCIRENLICSNGEMEASEAKNRLAKSTSEKEVEQRPSSGKGKLDLTSDQQTITLGPGQKEVVIIASYSLSTSCVKHEGLGLEKKVPSSDEIQTYLGVREQSPQCTAKLWTEAYNAGYGFEEDDSTEDSEIHTIARCVERIIAVSSIPANFVAHRLRQPGTPDAKGLDVTGVKESGKDTAASLETPGTTAEDIQTGSSETSKHSSGREEPTAELSVGSKPELEINPLTKAEETQVLSREDGLKDEANKLIPLIENIMTLDGVDFESMFWQIRMLVIAYNFLNKADVPNHEDSKSWYLAQIRSRISTTLTWLISSASYLQSSTSSHPTIFWQDQFAKRSPFRTICIWYIMHNWSAFSLDDFLPIIEDVTKNGEILETLASELDRHIDDYINTRPATLDRHSNVEKLRKDLTSIRDAILQRYEDVSADRVMDVLFEPADVECECLNHEEIVWVSAELGGLAGSLRLFGTSQLELALDEEIVKDEHDPENPQASKLWSALANWYYYGCLRHLVKAIGQRKPKLDLVRNIEKIVIKEEVRKREVEKLLRSYARRAQSEHRLEVDPNQKYLPIDEEIHRLALLYQDLGLQSTVGNQCVNRTCSKILVRQWTTRFCRGRDSIAWESDKDRFAPWELSCLNHHGLLTAVSRTTQDPERKKDAKDRCFEFLHADYTFALSWDIGRSDMLGDWWGVKVSSVICATLLLSKDNEKEDTGSMVGNRTLGTKEAIKGKSPISPSVNVKPRPLKEQAILDLIVDTEAWEDKQTKDQKAEYEKIIQAFKEAFKQEKNNNIEWKSFRPPGYAETYHPDFTLQSLDDTPERFTRQQIEQREKVELRSELREFLQEHEPSNNPDWSVSTIHQLLEDKDTAFISVFDVSLRDSSYFVTKVCRSLIDCYEISKLGNKCQVVEMLYKELGENPSSDHSLKINQIWTNYLNGSLKDWTEFPYFDSLNENVKKLLKQSGPGQSWYKDRLLTHLNDSLVDQDVNYRIFFAQQCPPQIIRMFVHIWHPEALDAFDGYINAKGAYNNSEVNNARFWITSITIPYWILKPKEIPSDPLRDFHKEKNLRKHGQIPPQSVLDILNSSQSRKNLDAKTNKTKQELEERVSSVVITGDHLGRFWIASVLSSSIKEEKMSSYAVEVQETMQLFVHWQSAGRRLAFISLVGHICKDIACEYSSIVSVLESFVEEKMYILWDGVELDKSKAAVQNLQRMIWGLESFRVFDITLASTLETLGRARVDFDHATREDEECWSKHLLKHRGKVLEKYDKHMEELSRVKTKIEQRVIQLSRLFDSIGAMTNVAQSLEGLEQNANIRILTFITIGYLPLGFVAALFALSDGILPKNAGRGLFIGLIFVFMAATFAFAILIPWISDSISAFSIYRREKRQLQEKIKRGREEMAADSKTIQSQDARQSSQRRYIHKLAHRNGKGGVNMTKDTTQVFSSSFSQSLAKMKSNPFRKPPKNTSSV